jgi:hypothetical protein
MKSIFILLIACLSFSSNNFDEKTISNTASCKAKLSVEKDRHAKSIYSAEGVSFTLELVNESSSTITYSVYTKKMNGSCGRYIDKNAKIQNIDLDVSFDNENSLSTSKGKQKTKEITLGAGESKKFKIKLKADKNTPYYSWGCIEVIADSKDCESSSVKTNLSVYVPDPSEK